MKLALKDVDKRISVKLDKSIKSSGVNGYMKFGTNNDYPQIIERLVNSSITAKSVSNIYSKFLSGSGFETEKLNMLVVGKDSKGKNITLLSLLRQVADSISVNNGSYIHVNVNLNGEVVDCRPVPFKNCRFASEDDTGYTAKIGVYDNWDKDSDRGKFNKSSIRWYNNFNVDKKTLALQVIKAGGVDKYKGQIYFSFLDNQYLYPLSPFDSVALDCDTEYQVSIFKNNTTRNGMTKKTIVRMVEPSNKTDEDNLIEQVKSWQGVDGDNMLMLYDEIDPETGELKRSGAFAIDSVESNIEDKLFDGWNKDLANNIRKAVKALPAILIDYEENKLGSLSGEGIIQATNFYNSMTQDDRALISEMFREIFTKFADKEIASNSNWNIKPISLYGGTTELGAATDV